MGFTYTWFFLGVSFERALFIKSVYNLHLCVSNINIKIYKFVIPIHDKNLVLKHNILTKYCSEYDILLVCNFSFSVQKSVIQSLHFWAHKTLPLSASASHLSLEQPISLIPLCV
jgi:hypothetical protein